MKYIIGITSIVGWIAIAILLTLLTRLAAIEIQDLQEAGFTGASIIMKLITILCGASVIFSVIMGVICGCHCFIEE